MQKISEISTLFDTNQDARNSTPYYILYREGRKGKAKLRQHEQRTSGEVRTQFVPFGARTNHDGKRQTTITSIKLTNTDCPDYHG